MTLAFAGIVLLASSLPPVAAGGPSAADLTTLKTTVAVLVGKPEPAPTGQAGVAIPTGTVIVPTTGNAPSPERFMRARKELRSAYRLGDVESTSYDDFTLARDVEQQVASATKAITTKATLLSCDDTTAVYRVRLLEDGKEAASPVVSVKRGQWAIVGGRDGAEAPYFFVLLRPCTLEDMAEESRWRDITRPTLADKVMPSYPEEARKAKTEGVVLLDCLIEKDGNVKDIQVKETPDPLLRDAALTAVRQWRYAPAKDAKGQPLAVRLTVTISFWLN
jgi:TonB family protein